MENSATSKLQIGLAFSGGGYRAAGFSLGVLSYLAKVPMEDGSLLEKIKVLSTVSGGTITGARYAIGISRKETMEEIYHALCNFMEHTDLISLGLDRLVSDEGWGTQRIKSLINAFADVYDRHLFQHAVFGALLNDMVGIHLKNISFNATEFANAVQFRFQQSEPILQPGNGEPAKGIIGNYYFSIPDNIAKDIRMGDILASSSCFPGGFEPINFPTDFVLPKSETLYDLQSQAKYPVGLMDGGIVDNQGIEPLLLAEARMKRNRQQNQPENATAGNVLDLLIITDVASPYMEEYVASEQQPNHFFSNQTPKKLLIYNTLLLVLAALSLVYFVLKPGLTGIILSAVVLTVSLLAFIIGKLITGMPAKVHVPPAFLAPLGKLLNLKIVVYQNILMNRLDSVLKMTNSVFLKHVRRLNYQKIYGDDSWKNRRIMNAIYELREGEEKLQSKIANQQIADYLVPSVAVQQTATLAAGMGTTLWFTKEDLVKDHMLNALIACGQFTICWNLLEYVDKISKDPSNTTPAHALLIACREQLLADWEHFKTDPYWLVKVYEQAGKELKEKKTV